MHKTQTIYLVTEDYNELLEAAFVSLKDAEAYVASNKPPISGWQIQEITLHFPEDSPDATA